MRKLSAMRIVSIITLIVLMASIMAIAPLYANAPNDNLELSYKVDFTKSLGISTSIPNDLGQTVTRAEFLDAVVASFNPTLVPAESTGFSDVSANHPYANAIVAGLERNIIYPADAFEPDAPITLNQAMKMSLCAVGYRERSELMGGYPMGYLVSATDTNLLRGVARNDEFTAADAYALLYNMLNIEILVKGGISTSRIDFVSSGKTLLNTYYDIYRFEGQVTATSLTGLSGIDSAVGTDKIRIGNEVFTCYLRELYLGYEVIAYYEDINAPAEVIYIAPLKHTVIRLAAKDIDTYENFQLNYTISERSTVANLARNYKFIYNGVYYDSYTNEDFKPDSGFVTLLDSNGDSLYDIVFVQDFGTMVIKNINYENRSLFDVNGSASVSIGEDEDSIANINLLTDEGYQPATFDDLTVGMVISYAISKNNKLLEVYQLDGITGVLTSISDEGVYIDDVLYQTSAYFNEYYQKPQKLKINSSATFYIGYDGIICAASVTTALDYQFGYLIRIITANDLASSHQTAILNTREVVITPGLAPKVEFNGNMMSSGDAYKMLVIGTDTRQQIIRYRLNSDGRLSGIYVDTGLTDLTAPFTLNIKPEHIIEYTRGTMTYKSNSGCLFAGEAGGSVRIDGGTAIFNVPDPNIVPMEYDFKKFTTRKPSDFTNDEQLQNAVVYNVSNSGLAGAVTLVGAPEKQVSEETATTLVEKISQSVNEEGEQVLKLSYWNNGIFSHSFFTGEMGIRAIEEKITPGDVLRISINDTNEITGFTKDFDFATKNIPVPGSEGARLKYRFGKIYAYNNNYLYMTTTLLNPETGEYDIGFDSLHLYPIGSARMVIFDSKINSISPARATDILDYMTAGNDASTLLVRQRYYDTNMIIIYK